jgi:hypothetical protein
MNGFMPLSRSLQTLPPRPAQRRPQLAEEQREARRRHQRKRAARRQRRLAEAASTDGAAAAPRGGAGAAGAAGGGGDEDDGAPQALPFGVRGLLLAAAEAGRLDAVEFLLDRYHSARELQPHDPIHGGRRRGASGGARGRGGVGGRGGGFLRGAAAPEWQPGVCVLEGRWAAVFSSAGRGRLGCARLRIRAWALQRKRRQQRRALRA